MIGLAWYFDLVWYCALLYLGNNNKSLKKTIKYQLPKYNFLQGCTSTFPFHISLINNGGWSSGCFSWHQSKNLMLGTSSNKLDRKSFMSLVGTGNSRISTESSTDQRGCGCSTGITAVRTQIWESWLENDDFQVSAQTVGESVMEGKTLRNCKTQKTFPSGQEAEL